MSLTSTITGQQMRTGLAALEPVFAALTPLERTAALTSVRKVQFGQFCSYAGVNLAAIAARLSLDVTPPVSLVGTSYGFSLCSVTMASLVDMGSGPQLMTTGVLGFNVNRTFEDGVPVEHTYAGVGSVQGVQIAHRCLLNALQQQAIYPVVPLLAQMVYPGLARGGIMTEGSTNGARGPAILQRVTAVLHGNMADAKSVAVEEATPLTPGTHHLYITLYTNQGSAIGPLALLPSEVVFGFTDDISLAESELAAIADWGTSSTGYSYGSDYEEGGSLQQLAAVGLISEQLALGEVSGGGDSADPAEVISDYLDSVQRSQGSTRYPVRRPLSRR